MLHAIDWAVIVAYLLLSLGIGLYYTRRAGSNLSEYFLSGRDTPWWLAGLSMVATTFAADTPLAVTELVRSRGIAGNWLWWNMLLGGMLTTFFFARLWRRAMVMTDLEFISIRYSGWPAHFLRGFRAVYQGLLLNAVIIGWVNLALVSILQVYFGLGRNDALLYTALCMLLTTLYATLSGLRGVLVTDAVQFVIAMVGCVVLAVVVLQAPQIGGMAGLLSKLPAGSTDFLPRIGDAGTGTYLTLGVGSFLAFAGVQWWSSWYPGAEPGGGGYVAQRMMSARSERDALGATLLFQVMHYAVRPWPWVLVGLCSLVLYPTLADHKLAYIYAMRDHLPVGLQGLLLVAFFAAYMSTISTQLNWGTSYLINDLYRRYWRPAATEAHYVWAARACTVLMMVFGLAVTTQLDSVAGAWAFIIECGAGVGLVMILRWYWWRISAWSELVATITPFIVYGICQYLFHVVDAGAASSWWQFPNTFFITVGCTTMAWLVATWLLPTTDADTLRAFVQRVQPQGWWGTFADTTQGTRTPMAVLALCWLLGVVLVYASLFAVGKLLFMDYVTAALLALLAAGSAVILVLLARRYPIFS